MASLHRRDESILVTLSMQHLLSFILSPVSFELLAQNTCGQMQFVIVSSNIHRCRAVVLVGNETRDHRLDAFQLEFLLQRLEVSVERSRCTGR